MISFTAEAQAHIEELERYYRELGREVAILRLNDALTRSVERIKAQDGPFLRSPRPYLSLVRYDWQWLKEWRYWIAFSAISGGFSVNAVFHERANIPGRL